MDADSLVPHITRFLETPDAHHALKVRVHFWARVYKYMILGHPTAFTALLLEAVPYNQTTAISQVLLACTENFVQATDEEKRNEANQLRELLAEEVIETDGNHDGFCAFVQDTQTLDLISCVCHAHPRGYVYWLMIVLAEVNNALFVTRHTEFCHYDTPFAHDYCSKNKETYACFRALVHTSPQMFAGCMSLFPALWYTPLVMFARMAAHETPGSEESCYVETLLTQYRDDPKQRDILARLMRPQSGVYISIPSLFSEAVLDG